MPAIEIGYAALAIAGWAVGAFCVYVTLLLRRTKQIRTDIATGIGKLEARVDDRERKLEALETKIEAHMANMPTIDEEALAIDYEEMAENLKPVLGPMMSEHVMMAFNQVRAQETKALQKQLDELGVEGVMDEAKGMIAEQLPPEMVQAQRILGMKVSKKYARENPIGAHLIEMAKLQLMQMMGGSMPSGAPHSESAPSGGSRGFGVR